MSASSNLKFSGSWVALITPMNEQGEIDFDDLRKLVDWHVDNGTTGLVVLGTTAETSTLTEQEQFQVLEVVIQQNASRLPLIVGNGGNCTRSTIEKTKKLDEYDIDGYLTVTPYYNRPNQKGMVAHFKAVAAATDKAIILYNVPARTGVDLSNESVIELMKVNNIVGIKDATGDLSRVRVMLEADDSFILSSGDDGTAREYMELGGHGVISVTANVEPKLVSDVVSASTNGEYELAKKVDAKLKPLHRDLFVEPNPVPSKWALKEKGIIKSDMVRLPLLTMEPIHQNTVKQALQQAR
ncbi:MAG: 4-hydroxy-tetrahydrodipicolinate synthase [Gammaproteobacteria bacterium]|nr:4-hydroxy-tetrahydrodipicolinate synthase [Gammaproteobacteria bacterium]